MNTSDPQGDLQRTAATSTDAQLKSQFEQLRYFFVLALVSLVVICLAVCVFMGKQWRTVKAQVEDQRATIQTMWSDYGKTTRPLIVNFVRSLQIYSAQHRDFQPILEKYRKPLAEYYAAPAASPSAVPGSR